MKFIVNKKRSLGSLCLACMLALTYFMCGCQNASENVPAKQKVVLNEVAHSIFYAPLYVAIENGYFNDSGIDLELITGFGADKTMTAVLSGDADIGFMGPETTIYTYLGNNADPVINFAQLTQRAGNFIVARSDQPTFSWNDLKGKTVLGGRAGGMPEMVFEYILMKNGIDPKKDLTIDQSIDFGATAAAFSGGKGDYTVEFEPGATALEEMNQGYQVVASLGVESGFVPYTCFSAKSSYVNSNHDIMQKFVDTLQRGMDYVNSHTAQEIAATIQPQFPETELSTITTIVNRYKEQNTWNTDLTFTKDSFELLENILESANELSERVPYENLVTTAFTEKASTK